MSNDREIASSGVIAPACDHLSWLYRPWPPHENNVLPHCS
jgi:hypothetical protein